MAEEKQTAPEEIEEIRDTLTADDTDVLRFVLKNTRGIAPVSLYNQADALIEDE